MDIFVLKALVDDLQQQLPGASVSKVYQMSRDDVLLRLWRGQDLRLLLSTHPTLQRLHLTESRFDNPQRPPRFAAFLRAHLHQVRVQNIVVQPYDRVVHLTWARPGEAAPALTLMHELTGPHANIILVDANGTILDALKHVQPDARQQRAILPGQPYQPLPLPPQRLPLSALTLAHLEQLQQQGTLDAPHLQRLLIGLSAGLAQELLRRSQGDARACWELLQQLRQHYDNATLSLSISTTPDGHRHLSVLPLTCSRATVEAFPDVAGAVAAFYEPAMMQTLVESLRHDVQATLRQRQQRLHKKLANLQQDYARLQSYLPYQHYGTLLVSQRLPRGATSATVVDYYHATSAAPATVTIALDPRLSGHENAQVYFKKYRKAKSGMTKVQTLLEQCTTEAAHLADLAQQVEQAEDWYALQALAEALATEHTPARQQPRALVRPRPAPAEPYRSFVSSDGYTLYCGKSNQGNDALLRQVAAPHDLWLHAHRQAGAHVLIKVLPQQEVPDRTLLEAAALAAYYSKGRHAAAVEVIWTPAKHVRKFRGARPGQVLVDAYRTLEVAPRLPGTGD
jgi:predicted ribosome quality control (RQC) complex YloA/Tae2 family protein